MTTSDQISTIRAVQHAREAIADGTHWRPAVREAAARFRVDPGHVGYLVGQAIGAMREIWRQVER